MNSVINGDSSGWSGIQKFVFNPSISYITTDSRIYDSTVTIYSRLPGQIEYTNINNLSFTINGFKLNTFIGNLFVKSWGSSGNEASYFVINNVWLWAESGPYEGLNFVKVSKLQGKVLVYKNFKLTSPQSSDSIVNFLNTFDTSHYLMIGYATYVPNSDSLRQNAKNKIRQFGSVYVDSTRNFFFDSWAFIGFLGASPEQVSEQFRKYVSSWIPSYASLQPTFQHTEGSINFSIGPSHKWKYFSWNQELPPYSQIKFDVTGINRSNQPITLYSNLTSNSFVSLDTINTYNYPYLSLKAKITIDTILGYASPTFKSLTLKLTPPAELIPDNYSFVRSDTIVQEGIDVTFSVKNYNVGYVPINAIINKWSVSSSAGFRILKQDTVYSPLQVDSFQVSTVTIPTLGIKSPSKLIDTVQVFFETSLLGNINEYFPYNNFAFSNFIVFGDSTSPAIDVTYDGKKINNGDLIRATPEIIYKFYDDSKIDFTMADTSFIKIKLDNKKINYYIGSQKNPEIDFTILNQENLKVIITYRPIFSDGEHQLQYIAADQTGNDSDTLTHNILVSYAFSIRDLYNYPNPMKGETFFTFNFFAEKDPPPAKIKIYSVAGRLIKEITAPVNIGFNQIYWDGKDNDGENIANGIYLYKIILEEGNKIETSIQKLAVLK